MDETGHINRAPDVTAMRRDLYSSSISDERTRAALKEAWVDHQLLLEPHGAVAWQGFLDWQEEERLNDSPAAILETAHPAKFPEEIEKTLGFSPEVPPAIAAAEKLPEDYDRQPADYQVFKEYLLSRHS
jgi:threonine synthase